MNARSFERSFSTAIAACPAQESISRADLPALRDCQAAAFYKTPFYKSVRDRYDVTVTPQDFGGVHTEVFRPVQGVSQANHKRVLVNLHGGGFQAGSHIASHLESIPIASLGRIEVISVDYRQAPEYTFPAASEDVVAVYRELLRKYPPKNIGVYGCSAGGLLTAQVMASLLREGLPLPAAVGMFFAGAHYWTSGDSGHLGAALAGGHLETARENPYLKGIDADDPRVFPAAAPQGLAKFPPSLLISGTRDFALSSVVHTHSLLVAHGVKADLHIWEGMGHAFFFDPELPPSREVYAVAVKFFTQHLGQ